MATLPRAQLTAPGEDHQNLGLHVRIAVSGAHQTGKTTLVGQLAASLPAYEAVEEPYYLLEDEGRAFAEAPTFDDYELQLERAIRCVMESAEDCVFDRCPLDLLAYLLVHEESDRFEPTRWMTSLRDAMQMLELVVFVRVETPERIAVPDLDTSGLRSRVDEEIRDIVLDDQWAFGVPAIEVSGTLDERTARVLAHVR